MLCIPIKKENEIANKDIWPTAELSTEVDFVPVKNDDGSGKKVFLLDVREANRIHYGYTSNWRRVQTEDSVESNGVWDNQKGAWWLRTISGSEKYCVDRSEKSSRKPPTHRTISAWLQTTPRNTEVTRSVQL